MNNLNEEEIKKCKKLHSSIPKPTATVKALSKVNKESRKSCSSSSKELSIAKVTPILVEDIENEGLSIKPMGPLNIQETPDYGIFSCNRKNLNNSGYCNENMHRKKDKFRDSFHFKVKLNQNLKLRRQSDLGTISNEQIIEDSLDDSSSISSDPSGTSTTTSSSMSSNGDVSIKTYPNDVISSSKNVKKDSSIQTDNASSGACLSAWKKYLHDQHISLKDNSKMDSDAFTSESLRLKLVPKSSHNSSNGKAVAVIKATTATTGRISNPRSPSRNKGKSSYFGYDTIYSDTEYIRQGSYYNKYSYLTSPVRLRSRVSNDSRDINKDSYSQLLSPWLSRNGLTKRNAMTEAESMESLTNRRSNKNGDRNSSRNKRDEIRKQMEKEGDLCASALSLVSNSTVFSAHVEDKNSLEIRKLKRELEQANEKVLTLTSQLNTNAHMVAAFEQSLSTMTARLQQLTSLSERKDCELNRLNNIIEDLSKHKAKSLDNESPKKFKEKKSLLIRRHTFASSAIDKNFTEVKSGMNRQHSHDSLSSNSDQDSKSSASKLRKKNKKHSLGTTEVTPIIQSKGWFRSSLSKAFRKNKANKSRGSISDAEIMANGSGHEGDSSSVPNSPIMSMKIYRDMKLKPSETDVVNELKKQLQEKEKALTDLRLEALSAAHQLDNFKDMINGMRGEMMNLKQDNERLSRLVINKSLGSSKSSMLSNCLSSPVENVIAEEEGGKRVNVSLTNSIIGFVNISPETTWGILDALIRKCIGEYLDRIDPERTLGISLESFGEYEVGSKKLIRSLRGGSLSPEVLPFGYLAEEGGIYVICRSFIESFVMKTLIPKSIIQRYSGILQESKRVMLYGTGGTGKSYLAQKLAEFMMIKLGKDEDEDVTGSIASFNIEDKSCQEVKGYLSMLVEQIENENGEDLPKVIILDNLQSFSSLDEIFNGYVNAQKCPFIIATMCQSYSISQNLQLKHNFRWLLCANHMEPVKGFLSRYLKRKLIQAEVINGVNNMVPIIDWIPKVWEHINRFLEMNHSQNVTLGPQIFSSCPIDYEASQAWFIELWNYSLNPYLIQITRDGSKNFRTSFEDPTDWILQTYPWTNSNETVGFIELNRVRLDDAESLSEVNKLRCDPLSDMLMRLQMAAKNSETSQSHN